MLVVVWFIFMIAFTIHNLFELSKVPPLSWKTVSLVFIYALVFIVSVVVLLVTILLHSIFSEIKSL